MKIFNLIIKTKKEYDIDISEAFVEGFAKCRNMNEKFEKVNDKLTWATIRPVVYSLKELRNNTWDTNRVDTAIKFLTENFEVKDDKDSDTSIDQDSE